MYLVRASSQSNGFRRNVKGDIKIKRPPLTIELIKHPINPMSWKCGIQLTKIGDPTNVHMISHWWRMFWFDTMTAFGNEVEPDVYCKNTKSFRVKPRQNSPKPFEAIFFFTTLSTETHWMDMNFVFLWRVFFRAASFRFFL